MSTTVLEVALGWRSLFANATYRSATEFRVQLDANTRVILQGDFTKPGGGAYTGSYEAPQFGTITKIIYQQSSGFGSHIKDDSVAVGSVTVSGNFIKPQDLFFNHIYPMQTAHSAMGWANLFPQDPFDPESYSTSSRAIFVNLDGSYTVIFGTGFTYSPSGALQGGTATHLGLLRAGANPLTTPANDFNGNFDYLNQLHSTEYGGFVTVPAVLFYNGLFDVMSQQQFFGALFSGATSVVRTGTTSGLSGPFDLYLNGIAITGDDSNSTFYGGLAHDEIHGGGGHDKLFGLLDKDTLWGDAGNDTLNGGIGNDTMYGGANNDILIGSTGRDIMNGDLGVDRFKFVKSTDSGKTTTTQDTILDFTTVDIIDFSAIDANGTAAGHAFIWRGTAAFSGQKGELRYYKVDNLTNNALDYTYIQGDMNGDKVFDFQVQIKGLFNLTSSLTDITKDVLL